MMSGFVVLIAPDLPAETLEKEFTSLLQLTSGYKQLKIPPTIAKGTNCLAAKLDSDASIHPGIVRDDQTGSWLLAAGTVIALTGDNDPITLLIRLLQAYINIGAKALEAYDGQFALVIYNGQENSLSVVSDTIGMFGIFYCEQGNRLLISSSALAIAAQTQSSPDMLAIEHFLRLGRLDADKTLWQDVKRLLGGMMLSATHNHVDKIEYWSPTIDDSISNMKFEEALDHSVDLLTHTFSRTLTREGKTWVDLTGGFDTRLVAMVVEKTKVPFTTYCMGPEDHPDVQFSRNISKEMKWEYVHTQLSEQWEPEQYPWFDTALGCGDGRVNTLSLATTMRGFAERNAFIKINVTGVGGENFRGYRWQTQGLNIGRTSKIDYDKWLNRIFSQSTVIPFNVMRYDRTGEVRRELHDFIVQFSSNYASLPNTAQIDHFEFARDSGFAGVFLSSVSGLERSLAPLFFKALVNFAFSLNYKLKFPIHHVFVRALLERENKKLADLDTTTGGPAIPIHLSNIHKFRPVWQGLANRAIEIGSKKILRKTVHLWPQPPHSEYPLPAWRTAFRKYAQSKGLLTYDNMCSGGLYKGSEFNAYIEHAEYGTSYSSEFVDRVISLEMAMRAVGTSID